MWLQRTRILHRISLGFLLTVGLCLGTPQNAKPADVIGDHVCAGTGCSNPGETFTNGEELKLKDTVPILRFEDTDTGNSDTIWQLEANNGAQKFSLVDKTNSKTPFTIEAGARTNALYVTNLGRVGIGTPTPQWNLQVSALSTPTIRLEQTSPFSLWDLQQNETGFFILDGVNFRTPFAILPNAPTSSFTISSNGNIGMRTLNPQAGLHIFGTAGNDVFNGIGPDLNNGPAFNFGYSGFSFGPGSGFFNVRGSISGLNPSLRFLTVNQQRMIITNSGQVGINNLNPSQQLDVTGNIRASGSFISGGTTLNVPDYVFAPDYQLMPLKQLAAYIEKEQHLPEIPSVQDIKTQGVDLGTMQMQLLKKVEELTLYTIAQEQTITTQAQTIDQLQGVLTDLTARLAVLEQARATEQPASKDTQHATQHRP